MRKTKIICTLGPATDDEDVLRRMILAGMNVARFNFSHGDHSAHLARLTELRKIRDELNLPVAALLDTKGPEIRLGVFEDPNGVVLEPGQTFTLTTRECPGTKERAYVNYEGLPADVKKGVRLLINDGLISLTVDKVSDAEIVCTVVDGGKLTDRKGVNVPGVSLRMPYLSARDMSDLQFGKENDYDFIAASFVRNATDVNILRNYCDAIGWRDVKIIAKIENAEGVSNIDSIIAASDGIMVARGDMGVEISFEQIPAIQKMIIKKVYEAGKIVVTATQMLESMITNPRPTRAEITDVANAIYDGTSAIMLSGESAVGKHPVEAVTGCKRIQGYNFSHRPRYRYYGKRPFRFCDNHRNQERHHSSHDLQVPPADHDNRRNHLREGMEAAQPELGRSPRYVRDKEQLRRALRSRGRRISPLRRDKARRHRGHLRRRTSRHFRHHEHAEGPRGKIK